jgi:hypothetical protein
MRYSLIALVVMLFVSQARAESAVEQGVTGYMDKSSSTKTDRRKEESRSRQQSTERRLGEEININSRLLEAFIQVYEIGPPDPANPLRVFLERNQCKPLTGLSQEFPVVGLFACGGGGRDCFQYRWPLIVENTVGRYGTCEGVYLDQITGRQGVTSDGRHVNWVQFDVRPYHESIQSPWLRFIGPDNSVPSNCWAIPGRYISPADMVSGRKPAVMKYIGCRLIAHHALARAGRLLSGKEYSDEAIIDAVRQAGNAVEDIKDAVKKDLDQLECTTILPVATRFRAPELRCTIFSIEGNEPPRFMYRQKLTLSPQGIDGVQFTMNLSSSRQTMTSETESRGRTEEWSTTKGSRNETSRKGVVVK